MKFGRKKSSSASSSKSSFISSVPFLSWLSKFKYMRVNREKSDDGKVVKQKGNTNSVSVTSSLSHYTSGIESGMSLNENGNDDFWRLHGEECNNEGKKSNDVIEIDDDLAVPFSSCNNSDIMKFEEEKEIGAEEESKLPEDDKISVENDNDYDREKELEKLRKTFQEKAQKALHEKLLKLEDGTDKAESALSTKSVEKDVIQLESPRTICTPRKNSLVHSSASKRPESIKTVEKQDLKKNEMKTSKPKHTSKVRIHSPRMAPKTEVCRIKAIEDLKKAKLKKKVAKERMMDQKTEVLDSFAVVRCSMNPEKDFKDSMIEMIIEYQIHQQEEFEELLTCYLILNSDEYHDLIIKVFREVWFGMNSHVLGISI